MPTVTTADLCHGKRRLPAWARRRSSCRRTTLPCSPRRRRRKPGRSWPERSPDIDRRDRRRSGDNQAVRADPEQSLRPLYERPGESDFLHLLRQRRTPSPSETPAPAAASASERCPMNNITLQRREARLGAELHPLHGLHLLLSRRGHRVRQKEPWQATVSF